MRSRHFCAFTAPRSNCPRRFWEIDPEILHTCFICSWRTVSVFRFFFPAGNVRPLKPRLMETRCCKVCFQTPKKKTAEDTLVPPLSGKRKKKTMIVLLILSGRTHSWFFSTFYKILPVHAAARGGTCVFTLKIVNTLIKNISRDDRPSISTYKQPTANPVHFGQGRLMYMTASKISRGSVV